MLDSDSRDRSIGGTPRLCLQHSKQGEETIRIAASGSEYLLGSLRKNGKRGWRQRERAKREHLVLIPALDTRGQRD